MEIYSPAYLQTNQFERIANKHRSSIFASNKLDYKRCKMHFAHRHYGICAREYRTFKRTLYDLHLLIEKLLYAILFEFEFNLFENGRFTMDNQIEYGKNPHHISIVHKKKERHHSEKSVANRTHVNAHRHKVVCKALHFSMKCSKFSYKMELASSRQPTTKTINAKMKR